MNRGRFDFRLATMLGCLALMGAAGAQTVTKLAVSPASVVGGMGATGTVTISAKAGADGVMVSLTSSNAAAIAGPSVTIEKGKTNATFKISTVAVASDTTATISGQVSVSDTPKSATLTVKAPSLTSFSLSPSSVAGGKNVTATAKISSAAPTAGLSIALASNNSAVTAPESLVIAAGAKSGTATLTTSTVGEKTTVKVTASLGHSSIGESVALEPLTLVSLTLNPSIVSSGSSSIGTLTISGPAPSSGLSVPLKSSVSTITVPASATVPSGATSTTFTITTSVVKTKSTGAITAKLSNSAAATLTLTPAAASPFAGKFSGSYYTTTPDLGSVNLQISSTGVLSGSSLDIWSTDQSGSSLSGTVTNAGNVTLTITNENNTTQTVMGTFTINHGLIVGTFPHTSNFDSTTVWLNQDGNPLEFAGNWTGTFTNSNQDTGSTNIKITVGGVISGTGMNATTGGTGTFAGTIDSNGVISLTFTTSGGTKVTNNGGAAYNASGQLILYLNDGSGDTTVVTLSKPGT